MVASCSCEAADATAAGRNVVPRRVAAAGVVASEGGRMAIAAAEAVEEGEGGGGGVGEDVCRTGRVLRMRLKFAKPIEGFRTSIKFSNPIDRFGTSINFPHGVRRIIAFSKPMG
jgi:hypothetical protein